MRITRLGRQIAAWLGVLALGLNALAPLATPARADVRVGICTASGFRTVPDGPSTPASPAEHAQCTLCTHCAPSSDHAAPGLSEPNAALVPRVGDPLLWDGTPPFSTRWVPGARPRAPPSPLSAT
jgi:hypothetical protein